jgi:hypothetical protein
MQNGNGTDNPYRRVVHSHTPPRLLVVNGVERIAARANR